MKYSVQIVVTEIHTFVVEGDDRETAKATAMDNFNNGETAETTNEYVDFGDVEEEHK